MKSVTIYAAKSALLSLAALALLLLTGPAIADGHDHEAEAQIKSLIEKAYVHGAFNELNPEAMEKGFHPDFAIFSPDGEELKKYPIADWTKRTAERKADPKFKAEDNKWTHNFAAVDVTGHAASVKIELSKDGKLVFTDYLSLLKFDSGWRIVGKVYFRHQH
ncbi:MAG: nuclear transport factor 2 family protein [Acidobacteriota bacterium]